MSVASDSVNVTTVLKIRGLRLLNRLAQIYRLRRLEASLSFALAKQLDTIHLSEEATALFLRAAEIYEKDKKPNPLLGHIYYRLSFIALAAGDLRAAREYGEKASRYKAESENQASKGLGHSLQGKIAYRDGRLEEAVGHFESAIALLENYPGMAETKSNIFQDLGGVYIAQKKFDLAETMLRKALLTRETLETNVPRLSNLHRLLGNVEEHRQNWAGAEVWYRCSLALEESVDSQSLETARDLQMVADVCCVQQLATEAEALYLRSIKIKEAKAPGSIPLRKGYFRIGASYLKCEDLREARGWYEKSLAMEPVAPDTKLTADTYRAVAKIDRLLGNLQEAGSGYLNSLKIYESIDSAGMEVAQVYQSMSIVERAQAKLDESAEWAQRSIDLLERTAPDSLDLANGYIELGNVAGIRKDWAQAEIALEKALAIREVKILTAAKKRKPERLSRTFTAVLLLKVDRVSR